MRLYFFEEDAADPTTQVALRVINADTAAIDVRYYPTVGGTPATATTVALGVASLTKSTYVTAAPAQVRYNVLRAGAAIGSAPLFADRIALIGAAQVTVAPGPIEALPGTTVAGSAVSAIVFPASVAGTGAPQGAGSATVPAWTSQTITYVFDRRPPRAAGT